MDKKIKIAIIGSRGYPYVYSGYETFVKELVERISDEFECTVYCHKNLFSEYPTAVKNTKLVYFNSVNSKVFSQLTHSFQSAIHVCFSRPDVVLAVNSANGIFGLFFKLFGIKSTINVDGLEWKRPKWAGLGAKYFYYSSLIATKLYDVIISDSTEMAKVYKEEFNSDSVVIEYGADLKYDDNSMEIEYEKDSYYLIVGRMIPDNNVLFSIQEFIASTSTRKLIVVGDVPYDDPYANEIKRVNDPRVILLGYVKDPKLLTKLYHNSYAYIHGHEFGGTNPTILKALAYGSCIIAIDTVFSREVLKEGEYGFLFEKRKGALSNLFNEVDLSFERVLEFRNKSRQRITERYTWEMIVQKYQDLFKGMISKN